MKLDRALIEQLLAMDDATLWATIRAYAATKKIHLSETPPDKATMSRLRAIFSGTDKYDLGAAVKILSNYRTRK